MPAIRYRPNNVCAAVLCEIPTGHVYLKKRDIQGQPAAYLSAKWLGFICLTGFRKFYGGRKCKLIARSISNGNGMCGEWLDIGEHDYVVGLAVQLDDETLGAYAVVGADGWPVVRSDKGPRLTVVVPDWTPKTLKFSKAS